MDILQQIQPGMFLTFQAFRRKSPKTSTVFPSAILCCIMLFLLCCIVFKHIVVDCITFYVSFERFAPVSEIKTSGQTSGPSPCYTSLFLGILHLLHDFLSYHLLSWHIISCQIISYHIISCRIISYCIVLLWFLYRISIWHSILLYFLFLCSRICCCI